MLQERREGEVHPMTNWLAWLYVLIVVLPSDQQTVRS
jgi:hypothetical protein